MNVTKPLQGIILDVDGTILDSQSIQYAWLRFAAERFGGVKDFPANNAEFWSNYNRAYETKSMPGLYEMVGVDFQKHAKEIWPAYIEFNRTNPIALVPGAKEAVREVFSRSRVSRSRPTALRLGMNTTKTWSSVEKPLEEIIPCFDTIVTKDDVYEYCTDGMARKQGIQFDDYAKLRTLLNEDLVKQLEKPSSICSWLAVQRLGVEPAAVIAFEDTAVGIASYKSVLMPKRRADICVVGVSWGYQPRAELESAGADYVIDKPEQMVSLVADLGGFA